MMIIRSISDKKYDEYQEKARGIIVDENNKIMLISIENNYCLPGGDVEDGENINDAVKRELLEEIGLDTDNLMYLNTFIHYHENYKTKDDGEFINRVNKIHYFYKRITSDLLKENNPTEYELEHGMKVVKFSYDEILGLLVPSDDLFTNALNEETLNILEYVFSEGLI